MMNGDTKVDEPSQENHLLGHTDDPLTKTDLKGGPKSSTDHLEVAAKCQNGIKEEDRSDNELTDHDNNISDIVEIDPASAVLVDQSCELGCDADDVTVKDVTQDHSTISEQGLNNQDKRQNADELERITQPFIQNERSTTDGVTEGSLEGATIQPLQTDQNEVEVADNIEPTVLGEKSVTNPVDRNETASNVQHDEDEHRRESVDKESSKDTDLEMTSAVHNKETTMEVDEIDGHPPNVDDGETSQDQEEHPSPGLTETVDNGDMEETEDDIGEWRIEISDVRTIEDTEEDESDSSGSMAVVDLELSKSLSQSTDFSDDFSSPICRDKAPKGDNRISTDRPQEESDNSAKMNASPENTDSTDKGSISNLSSHKDVDNPPTGNEKDEDKDGNNQKTAEKEFEVDTGTDMLQDLYNQTSSLHDPELSTMNTTEEAVATTQANNKPTPTKSTTASDLLTNLAESVKKIKSEPKDSGYDKALNTSKESSPLCITNLSLGERLRLPPNMCQSVSNNGTKTSGGDNQANTFRKITPDLPLPSVQPFMPVVVTTQTSPQTTTISSSLANNVVNPNNNAMQIATNSNSLGTSETGNSSIQSKTVAYLVPVSNANSGNRQVFVSVPSLSTKESDKTKVASTSQPTLLSAATSKSTILKGNNNNDPSMKSIEEDVFNMCVKHKVKSVDLMKVTEFLQRKNAIKSFKGCKPPDYFNLDKKSHNCLECGDSFALGSSLDDHMKRCSMKIDYYCYECKNSKEFRNKCQLLSHMRTHASAPQSNKPLPPLKINSELISILTPSAEDLETVYPDVDISSVPVVSVKENKLRCQICNVGFEEKSQLRHHFGYNDVICSFAYQCPSCPQILSRQCALKAHMRIHQRSPPFVCPECGTIFMGSKAYNSFAVHLIEDCYHSNRVPVLRCSMCAIKLDSISRFKSHLLSVHVKIFMKCQLCSLAFDKRERYNHHMKSAHQLRGGAITLCIHSCEICNTLLQTKELLDRHMDLHVQEMKKNAMFGFKCSDCVTQTPTFATRQLLFTHKQSFHKKEKLWHRCFDCALKFKTPKEYTVHQNIVHRKQGEQKTVNIVYRCRNCELTFLSASQLNAHSCSGPVQSQLVVGMCAKCKTVLPRMDFDSHKCPASSSSSCSSVKSPQNTQSEHKVPFPVQILSTQSAAETVSSLSKQSDLSNTSVDKSVSKPHINYRCMRCNKVFTEREMLESHFPNCRNTHEQPPMKPGHRMTASLLSCNFCGVRFPTKKRLTLHIKEHNRKGNPMCHNCKIVAFQTTTELKEHLLTCNDIPDPVDPKEKETCKICNKKLYFFEKVKHFLQHQAAGLLICRHCQKMDFSDKHELTTHEIECGFVDHPLEHSYCYLCKKTFAGLEHLVVHLQEHAFEGTLICCKCQRTGFKNKHQLQAHHETCGKALMESMPGQLCSLCRETFPSLDISKLYRHLTQHVVKGIHICCNCQKMGWDNFHEMKSHQISCGSVESERKRKMPFQCKICNEGFMSSEPYQRHVRIHRDHGSLICVKCHILGWRTQEELCSHENECKFRYSEHKKKDVQDLKLTVDQSKFKNLHQKVPYPKDTDSQGYKTMDHFCEHCGKKFSKLSLLQMHVSLEHTSFPCHLCGLTYESKAALVSHVNVVHDGKRTFFSCEICKSKQISRKFASHQGLQKHMQKAHKHCRRPSNTDEKDGEEKGVQPSSSIAVTKTPSPPPVKRLRVEGDTTYTCAKCSLVTDDAVEFAKHIKEHNKDQANQCPDCGLCFTILPALKKHLFMVHKIRDSDKYLMDRGMKTEEEEYISDSEETSPVIKKMKLMTEQEDEEVSSGNPLECSVCHREFSDEKQIRTHMRIHGMAFIRSRRRNGSRMNATSSPPQQESPKLNSSVGSGSSGDKVDKGLEVLKKEKIEVVNKDSFPVTTLREETVEVTPQIEGHCSSKEEEILGNIAIKQEVMDCSN